MLNKPTAYIFSAFKSDIPAQMNEVRHQTITGDLTRANVQYVDLIGNYKGVIEKSVMAVGVKEEFIKKLIHRYHQESYLKLHSDNFAELIFQDGTIQTLGYLIEVNKEAALKEQNYSYVPTLNRYYITK